MTFDLSELATWVVLALAIGLIIGFVLGRHSHTW